MHVRVCPRLSCGFDNTHSICANAHNFNSIAIINNVEHSQLRLYSGTRTHTHKHNSYRSHSEYIFYENLQTELSMQSQTKLGYAYEILMKILHVVRHA